MAVEVDLDSYFEKIKSVCPWSNAAWKKGAIDIRVWNGTVYPLGSYEARIYFAPNHKYRQLKKMSNKLNDTRPTEEWLWSHPRFGYNSTPVGCFIQQDRDRLEKLRKNMGF